VNENEIQQAKSLQAAAWLALGSVVMIFSPVVVTAAVMAGITAGGLALLTYDATVGRAPRAESIRLLRSLHSSVLLMDQRGWDRGCWADPARRVRWRAFMLRVGSVYRDVANSSAGSWGSSGRLTMQKNIVPLLKEFNAWSGEMLPSTPSRPGICRR
jgi:hypothetical protein